MLNIPNYSLRRQGAQARIYARQKSRSSMANICPVLYVWTSLTVLANFWHSMEETAWKYRQEPLTPFIAAPLSILLYWVLTDSPMSKLQKGFGMLCCCTSASTWQVLSNYGKSKRMVLPISTLWKNSTIYHFDAWEETIFAQSSVYYLYGSCNSNCTISNITMSTCSSLCMLSE